jgi:uncharacterized protein (DUF433 family)
MSLQTKSLSPDAGPILTDYFEFLAPDDIRIAGTRIGIETILYDYLERGKSPALIADTYPSLTLEQVYATLTYYHHHQEAIDRYLAQYLAQAEARWLAQNQNPTPAMLKIRQAKAQVDEFRCD